MLRVSRVSAFLFGMTVGLLVCLFLLNHVRRPVVYFDPCRVYQGAIVRGPHA